MKSPFLSAACESASAALALASADLSDEFADGVVDPLEFDCEVLFKTVPEFPPNT